MNLLFLGTSAGVPTKTRNVTGIAVREDEGSAWYLIDCGEATQHQILHTNLSLNSLNAIFITHVHGDHCYGLPGLLASAGMNGRKDPLTIIAPEGIKAWFEATQTNTQLYLPFELDFISADALPSISFEKVQVNTTRLSHRVSSYAYAFIEKGVEPALDIAKLALDGIPQGPLWGKLKKGLDIEYAGKLIHGEDYLLHHRKPRKMVIAGDNDRPELLSQSCSDANVLVHEATYTRDVAEKTGQAFGHSYARLVAEFAQSRHLPNLVLTHFSPRYQSNTEVSPSIEDIYQEAKAVYSGGLYIASDFAQYHLNKAGDLLQIKNN